MTSDALKIFQDRVGHHFRDEGLLQRALTHASKGGDNYERLEFLGDRVLGLCIAELIFTTFPFESEGGMAKRHAALACTETLVDVAKELDIASVIYLSEAERAAGGLLQGNLLADAMEAVIGALYLDGGLEACKSVIHGLWGEKVHVLTTPPLDPKTGLQEWAQARKLPTPVYTILSRTGPDHAPTFEIEVRVDGFPPQSATGASRKMAEKDAATLLLNYLETHHWHDHP
jgi:ribonuclease III